MPSQAGQPVIIQAIISDQYTDVPIELAYAELFHDDELLASGYSDSQGHVELNYMATGVALEPDHHNAFSVGFSYPNPFVSSTSIDLTIDKPQVVYADVYNAYGQLMASANDFLSPGTYTLKLSVPHLTPGIYFLTVRADKTRARTIELLKTGEKGGSPRQIISFGPDYSQPNHVETVFWEDKKPHANKQLGGDYTLRVQKDRYGTREHYFEPGRDTTLTVPLSRQNKVALMTVDDQNDTLAANLLISGHFFHLEITAPDTLIMPSGIFSAKSKIGFIIPFEKEFEIPSVDTTIILRVEKAGAIVYTTENPNSELLFAAETEHGTTSFYYGMKEDADKILNRKGLNNERTGMAITHVTVRHPDNTTTTLIYNELYYPIMWINHKYVIGLRRLDGAFDPERTSHLFIYDNKEDTATINIRPGNLYELLDWLELQTGKSHDSARQFLDQYANTFDVIQQRAMTENPDQGIYMRAAIAFSTMAALKAFEGIEGKQYSSTVLGYYEITPPFTTPSPDKSPWGTDILTDALANSIAQYLGLFDWDKTGPVVNIYLCRGASKYYNICNYAFFTGTVSHCLSICKASMDCFTDICRPDVMNVNQALNALTRY